jgi:threonine/homoserine/homoserine lactone efflux protein
MRNNDDRPSAPNFTQACIVMFGVNLTWIFFMIWAIWGIMAVAATGWILNHIINRIGAARS